MCYSCSWPPTHSSLLRTVYPNFARSTSYSSGWVEMSRKIQFRSSNRLMPSIVVVDKVTINDKSILTQRTVGACTAGCDRPQTDPISRVIHKSGVCNHVYSYRRTRRHLGDTNGNNRCLVFTPGMTTTSHPGGEQTTPFQIRHRGSIAPCPASAGWCCCCLPTAARLPIGSHAGSIVGSSVSSGSRLLSRRLLFTTTCTNQGWCLYPTTGCKKSVKPRSVEVETPLDKYSVRFFRQRNQHDRPQHQPARHYPFSRALQENIKILPCQNRVKGQPTTRK